MIDWLRKLLMSGGCREVFDSLLNEPQEWKFGEYTASNKKRNISLWVGNGVFFLQGYEEEGTPAFIRFHEKFLLNSALKRSKQRLVEQKFK